MFFSLNVCPRFANFSGSAGTCGTPPVQVHTHKFKHHRAFKHLQQSAHRGGDGRFVGKLRKHARALGGAAVSHVRACDSSVSGRLALAELLASGIQCSSQAGSGAGGGSGGRAAFVQQRQSSGSAQHSCISVAGQICRALGRADHLARLADGWCVAANT